MAKEEEKDSKETVLIRVNKEIAAEAKDIADELGQTFKSFTDEALKEYTEKKKYNIKKLVHLAEKKLAFTSPVYKIEDKINLEFKTAPRQALKDLITMFEEGDKAFLLESSSEELLKKIESMPSNDLFGIFLNFSIKDEKELDKISKILVKIQEKYGKELRLNAFAGMSNENADKVMLFIIYKVKKEPKSGENDGQKI